MLKRHFGSDILNSTQYGENYKLKKFKKSNVMFDCKSNKNYKSNGIGCCSDQKYRFSMYEYPKDFRDHKSTGTNKSSPFNKARRTFTNILRCNKSNDFLSIEDNIESKQNSSEAIIEQFEESDLNSSTKGIENSFDISPSPLDNEINVNLEHQSMVCTINKNHRKAPQNAHGYAQQLHYILETCDADNSFLQSEHKNGQLNDNEFVVIEIQKSFGIVMALVQKNSSHISKNSYEKWQVVIDAQLAEKIYTGSRLLLSFDNYELDNDAYLIKSINTSDPATYPFLVQPNKVLMLS